MQVFMVIILLLIVIVALIYLVNNYGGKFGRNANNRVCARKMRQWSKTDISWHPEYIAEVVRDVYFKAQAAWAAQNNALANRCLSERLQAEWQEAYSCMQSGRERNVLENIELLRSDFVNATRSDSGADSFTVHITGKMTDYTVDTESGQMVGGQKEPQQFEEDWDFVRSRDGWVLDSIRNSKDVNELVSTETNVYI